MTSSLWLADPPNHILDSSSGDDELSLHPPPPKSSIIPSEFSLSDPLNVDHHHHYTSHAEDDVQSLGSFPTLMDQGGHDHPHQPDDGATTCWWSLEHEEDGNPHHHHHDATQETPYHDMAHDMAHGMAHDTHHYYTQTSHDTSHHDPGQDQDTTHDTHTHHLSIPEDDNHHFNEERDDELSPEHFRLTNPVHMELQENAKLPTFYQAVCRKGSSIVPPSRPPAAAPALATTTTTTAHSVLTEWEDETNLNLAELFLADHHRTSYHGQFQDALRNRKQQTDASRSGTDSNQTTTTTAASVTPLLESLDESHLVPSSLPSLPLTTTTTTRHHLSAEETTQSSTNNSTNSSTTTPMVLIDVDPTPWSEMRGRTDEGSSTTTPTTSTTTRHHPHSRSKQPLTFSSLSTTSHTTVPITGALETAAALAQHATTATTTTPPKVPPSQARVLEQASQQRQQFGFGRKHVVPAVPSFHDNSKRKTTKPATTTSTIQNNNNNNKAPSTASTTRHHTRTSSTVVTSTTKTTSVPAPPTTTPRTASPSVEPAPADAYERKKQRAKDARVKLNESIDRLHVAIRLAMTQSQQRVHTLHHPQFQTACQQTIATAENAKKWDRPSFVGTAATIIQSLNAQCEALLQLQAAETEASKKTEETATQAKRVASELSHDNPTAASTSTEEPSPSKRQCTESSDAGMTHSSTHDPASTSTATTTATPATLAVIPNGDAVWSHHPAVVQRIASFLDPVTMLRCHGLVCQTWKSQGSFHQDSEWERLALARFGTYSVRQGKSLWDDENNHNNEEESHCQLYQSLDLANAMPHVQFESASQFLGETRRPGWVSAWVYLMERSNGETLRSVRTTQGSDANPTTRYQSLPVVELRTVIQNTGPSTVTIDLTQSLIVDASTRRRSEEMMELETDVRFQKRVLRLNGQPYFNNSFTSSTPSVVHLQTFDAVVIVSCIHASNCTTLAKFGSKANFAKLNVQLDQTTVPLVLTFKQREGVHVLHR